MLEAGVGTAASGHVFATFPKLAWGTELFGPLLLTEEILTEPLDYAELSLAVPTGPGLGGGAESFADTSARTLPPARLAVR
jgi:muconate cycloisomerase